MISFKDFNVVDYTQTGDEYLEYQAQKRHRGTVGEETLPEEDGLSLAGRRALARSAKRRKARLKLSRKKALRKTAGREVVQNRATKQVRNSLFKRFSKGKSRGDLSPARRKSIEKRLSKMKTRIGQLSRRAMPDVRKLDRSRKVSK